AEDGIRDGHVTGVQTCALPISRSLCVWSWHLRVGLRLERIGLAAALPRLPHGRDGLPRTVRDGEEPEIGGGDLALPRDAVFQPLHETGPVLRSEQDHGEVAHLP